MAEIAGPKWITREVREAFDCEVRNLPSGWRLTKLTSKPK
jgi:hypothetical protein